MFNIKLNKLLEVSGIFLHRKHVECTLCRYASSCANAYANHMLGVHSGKTAVRRRVIPRERRCAEDMYCLCGFNTR